MYPHLPVNTFWVWFHKGRVAPLVSSFIEPFPNGVRRPTRSEATAGKTRFFISTCLLVRSWVATPTSQTH
nr:hypothetical protein Q903MT_gene1787 [Picea sitchensis]